MVVRLDGATPYVAPASPQSTGTTGTNAPGFKNAVNVAQKATSDLPSGKATETTVQNDWNSVEKIMERQYQIALTSADPAKAVAALDSQFESYLPNNKGLSALIYNGDVATAKAKANDSVVAAKTEMTAGLRSKFGNGDNGVYSAAQIQAAATALGQSDPSDAAVVRLVAADMEKGAPEGGIFGSNGAGVPGADRRFLKGLNQGIDTNLYGIGGQSNKGPATGVINPNTLYDVTQYLAGNLGNRSESPSQRLANTMSVLGPSRTYAVLADLTPAQAHQLGIQNSLNALTNNLAFTAGDAKDLALAQASFATSQSQYDFPGIGSVGSLMNSLPKDQNGTAVKIGYAQGCIEGAQRLAQEIGSGKYAGQVQNQLTATLNGLLQNATNLSTGFTDPVKEQLFSELHKEATRPAGTGAAKEGGVLNAYAANILGSMGDKSQVAAILRAMGGVGADGAIDPSSDVAKFLRSALSGQSQLGIASYFSNMTPYGQMPQGVTSLLNAISGSGDTKLMAGTLDAVMQWTISNPTQAEALAAQDAGSGATGYREALTHMLDNSFNQFIALDPFDANATKVRSMQPQTLADLQALSAVEMGPPYDSKVAGDFANVIGKHAVQFAAYATGQENPTLDRLFAGIGHKETQRNASAVTFGQIMDAFGAGLNQSQASARALATKADLAATLSSEGNRIVTDFLRGAGTGLLLGSFLVPSGGIGVAGVKLTEKLVSVFGRIGLFSGSIGTLFLDQGEQGNSVTERQAVQAVSQGMRAADLTPTQALQQLYGGWYSTMTQLPGNADQGDANQGVLDGVMTGSSFAAAPMIETDVQGFYNAYDPMAYYHGQTGQYPSVS
jgi:hypothetical protein